MRQPPTGSIQGCKRNNLASSRVVACIPAYNEEETIAKVVLLAKRYADEVIVCDDGSTDMTAEIAEHLGATVVRHEENLGYGAAISTLLREAKKRRPDVAVTLDADGQHDPGFIPELIEPILRGRADVVIGSRFLSPEGVPEVPTHRRFGIRLITRLTNLYTRLGLTDAQSGFRAYGRRALEVINPTRSDMGVSLEILEQAASHGLKIVEVPTVIRYRGLRETSTKNPLRHGLELIGTLLDSMTWDHPLLYLGIPGAASLVVSLSFAVRLLHLFNRIGYFSLPMAILGTAFGLFGLVLLSTALMLHAIRRAAQRGLLSSGGGMSSRDE